MRKSAKSHLKTVHGTVLTVAAVLGLAAPSLAQSITTLRDPLIPGADYTNPDQAATTPLPPPPGQGTYLPVTPGMSGSPGYEPWVTNIPADSIDQSDTNVTLPVQPSDALAPYAFRQQVSGSIPFAPSTPGPAPGPAPGIIVPNNSGYQPPAIAVPLGPGGTMPADQAPQKKWGGQASKDYGRNVLNGQNSGLCDFGQRLTNMPNLAKQPQFSQDGPRIYTRPNDYTSPSRQPQLTNSYGPAQETSDFGIPYR